MERKYTNRDIDFLRPEQSGRNQYNLVHSHKMQQIAIVQNFVAGLRFAEAVFSYSFFAILGHAAF